MALTVKTKKLRIGGMTCVSCQNKIEKKLKSTAGILEASVSYGGGFANVTYDTDILSLKDITAIIQKLGYEVLEREASFDPRRTVGILLIVAALYMLLSQLGFTKIFNAVPLAGAGMGYGMLFVIGLLTSFHCVAMCGGINLSQCIPPSGGERESRFASLRPSLLYNAGRVISYTVVGGIVGALGSAVSFSGGFKGIVQLIAGVFMVIMGLNMLSLFPFLRRLNPRMPKIFARGIESQKAASKSPLVVGLLNGLMPCGPLQAMQIYALSTGSPLKGALSMMVFALGTLPLMFGLGALSSFLSKKFTHRVMTAGAVLVVVLGLSMFSQGWALSGFSALSTLPQGQQSGGSQIAIEDGVQVVRSTLSSGRYPAITVEAGRPVRWIIDAPKGAINGCNNRIVIPAYNIEYAFSPGENVIEFTPGKTGKFPYSCWMGMIRSSITVVEAGGAASPPAEDSGEAVSQPVPAGVKISAENITVAEITDGLQQIRTSLTDDGLNPGVIVLQEGLETRWVIENSSTRAGNATLLFPFYTAEAPMAEGENPIILYPSESFEFSTGDNAAYGYVAVVEDITKVDLEKIRVTAQAFETLVYPPEYFANGGPSGASCH